MRARLLVPTPAGGGRDGFGGGAGAAGSARARGNHQDAAVLFLQLAPPLRRCDVRVAIVFPAGVARAFHRSSNRSAAGHSTLLT